MSKSQKLYNVTRLAEKLDVTRQTIHLWIRRGWVKPKKDYRDYPVFTEKDIVRILKWKNKIK